MSLKTGGTPPGESLPPEDASTTAVPFAALPNVSTAADTESKNGVPAIYGPVGVKVNE